MLAANYSAKLLKGQSHSDETYFTDILQLFFYIIQIIKILRHEYNQSVYFILLTTTFFLLRLTFLKIDNIFTQEKWIWFFLQHVNNWIWSVK